MPEVAALTDTRLDLPPAYRLVRLATVDSVSAHALRLARQGAEEGLVVWADEQSDARGRNGQPWQSPAGNLYCAILMRPDFPLKDAGQLAFVSLLALGSALAALVPPMTDLKYRWPNDLLINGGKVASVQLAAHDDAEGTCLVISLFANVASAPVSSATLELTSLHGEAVDEARVEGVLEDYSRHFLHWINVWANDGFEKPRKAWSRRLVGLGEGETGRRRYDYADGAPVGIEDNGDLLVEREDGTRHRLSLERAFNLT